MTRSLITSPSPWRAATRRLLCCVAGATLALGCGSSSKKDTERTAGAGDPAKERAALAALTDPLWALAPADTVVAVVVGDRTGDRVFHAIQVLDQHLANMPGGHELRDQLDHLVMEALDFDPRDRQNYDRFGLDLQRGAAVFLSRSEEVTLVVPLGDREKFLREAELEESDEMDSTLDSEGGCKAIAGRYVCAMTTERLDMAGKSDAMSRRMATTSRGHLESWVDLSTFDEEQPWAEYFRRDAAMITSMKLEPGGFTLRAHFAAEPTHPLVQAATRTSSDRARAIAAEAPIAMARFTLPIFDSILPKDQADGLLAPLGVLGGIDVRRDLIENITGELVMYAPANAPGKLVLEAGVNDGRPLIPLVKSLCNLAAQEAPQFGATLQGERCTATLDLSKILGADAAGALSSRGPQELSLEARDHAVVLEIGQLFKISSGTVTHDELARDLFTGSWNVASWGQGLAFNTAVLESMEPLRSASEISPIATGVATLIYYIHTVGVAGGVRDDGVHLLLHVGTQFGNPGEVFRPFHALIHRALDGDDPERVQADLDALVAKHPDTALGRSYRADRSGVSLIPMGMIVGVFSAIAIPSFVKYIKKSKTAEATQFVKKIYDGARAHYMDTPQPTMTPTPPHFPKPSVGPTPPLGTCCQQEDGLCQPDAAQWEHPTWVALQFGIDEPHRYSYQYEVVDPEGEFVVRAFGDLDCDGEYSTFEMQGIVDTSAADGPSGGAALRRINELE